jgi:predicted amidophosphoribosyltransferase
MVAASTKSNHKLHEITFCKECAEPIPARALTCFHCGAGQKPSGKTVRVIFCERCGKDYPVKAMRCIHCGHRNPRDPLIKGRISR